MQSKRQIEQLLSSSGVRPNKRFGQHFLIDLNLMRLLIDSADIRKNDVVLEVGCATGSLTEAITEKAGFCVAVEIDAVLAQIAKTQLADRPNLEIIAADCLKNKFEINPVVIDALSCARSEHKGRLLLIANLPYAAGTPLMLNLITGKLIADAMFVTVQKEVADRMMAITGTKDYGILSILLSATGDVKHIRTLKPTVFWPKPQVNSAMISYIRNAEKIRQIKSIETLSAITGGLLQHRRKMLKAGCKLITGKLGKIDNWPEIFAKCRIDPNNRPDQLKPEQFVCLANLCA
ncbi:MAG: ribosomal RNA small subunit methyltransferase A [Sedimentisphaerales bacterium]|nr:ribosomal RNA small subunit methyltransferase A [Sedimentisphaerales bacterium]